MSQGRAVVIGGGVIGAACAHFLQRDDWDVVIVDRHRFGAACSHGNCGYVCPSHVLPLSEPGVIAKSLKTIFRKGSALKIKPRMSPALWSWLINFARECNEGDMLETGAACHALLDSSMKLYDELFEQEQLDCEWQKQGLLFVYRSASLWEKYAKTDKLMREHFGVPATKYDASGVQQLEPALRDDVVGGWHYEGDAHLRPDKLMSSWREVLESRGAAVKEHCHVRRFITTGGGASHVVTDEGDLDGDLFVVATGAMTPKLQQHLGCRIPIQPGKGYSITMPRPAVCPEIPLIFPEDKVAVTPMETSYRLGSMMEFVGYDESIPEERLELLKTAAAHYLRDPYREPIEERWFGWRPMTYDGRPIIDRSPAMSNVIIAAGHNMLGLSMAPATGKLVSEMASARSTHIDPKCFAVGRF